jgi:hypothetical protein
MLLWLTLVLLKGARGGHPPRRGQARPAHGLSAGLHPNAMLLACGCARGDPLSMIGPKRFRLKPVLTYVAVTGGVALVFVGISLSFDPRFFSDYLRYGETEFDLLVPVTDKFHQVACLSAAPVGRPKRHLHASPAQAHRWPSARSRSGRGAVQAFRKTLVCAERRGLAWRWERCWARCSSGGTTS